MPSFYRVEAYDSFTQQVMHNPGTLPDRAIAMISKPDITAVSEESLVKYRGTGIEEALVQNGWDRSQCCIILHTVLRQDITALVRELECRAAYLFITELGPGAFYQKWGAGWEDFVNAMANVHK